MLSDADKEAILGEAPNTHDSKQKIWTNKSVKANLSTVQIVLKNTPHLKALKSKGKSLLTIL